MEFKKKKKLLINFRIDETIIQMLDKVAKINDMSRSEVVRQILYNYCKKELLTKNNDE